MSGGLILCLMAGADVGGMVTQIVIALASGFLLSVRALVVARGLLCGGIGGEKLVLSG